MKNRFTSLIAVAGAVSILAGCAPINKPEPWNYDPFLASSPKTLLVVMPTSEASNVKAPAACLAGSVIPLSEAGYYPLPVAMVNDTFRLNGVNDAAEIRQIPREKLKEVFGADAALLITVLKYETKYVLLDSVTNVHVGAQLVDLNNGAILWENRFAVSNANTGSGSLLAKLVGAVVKHVVNETTDQGYSLARLNAAYLYTPGAIRPTPILAGPYHRYYHNDPILQKIKVERGAEEDQVKENGQAFKKN